MKYFIHCIHDFSDQKGQKMEVDPIFRHTHM